MISNQYKVIDDLGQGLTAQVKLVQDVKTGVKYACKVIKPGPKGIDENTMIEVQKEMTIASQLKHPNIIEHYAVGMGPYDKKISGKKPEDTLFILMEYAPNGELFDMISKSGKYSEPTARFFFKQLLNAIAYMHNTVGVCHRDLKPENILIDENFNLKVADFGFSIPIIGAKGNGKLHSYKGTLGYMPPEQHAKKAYSGKQADLFALAIVLFMMITQCQPFDEAKINDKLYRLIAGNKPQIFWRIFEKAVPMSDDLKDLITGMLQLNPDARYTLDEILIHPWVQGQTPTNDEILQEFKDRSTAMQTTGTTAN